MKLVKFYSKVVLGLLLCVCGCNGIKYVGTPLHQAARAGDLVEVQRLVESGVDVNKQDENGERAVWLAVRANHDDVAKYLIDNGSDLNYRNSSGESRRGLYNYPKKNVSGD